MLLLIILNDDIKIVMKVKDKEILVVFCMLKIVI